MTSTTTTATANIVSRERIMFAAFLLAAVSPAHTSTPTTAAAAAAAATPPLPFSGPGICTDLYATGVNSDGLFGNGPQSVYSTYLAPTHIGTFNSNAAPLTGLRSISAASAHSVVAQSDGIAYASGRNWNYQLGLGDRNDRSTWTPVTKFVFATLHPPPRIVQVAAGGDGSFFLDESGDVFATGRNLYGQLGLGDGYQRVFPHKIRDWNAERKQIPPIVDVAASWHTLFLADDGTVFASGRNDHGQLGLGDNSPRNFPERIPHLSDVVQIQVGEFHSVFLQANGTVWSCGFNSGTVAAPSQSDYVYVQGPLGVGDDVDRNVPTQVEIITGDAGLSSSSVSSSPVVVKSIAASKFATMFLLADGTVLSTGSNIHGELGAGLPMGSASDDAAAHHRIAPGPVSIHGTVAEIYGPNSNDWYFHLKLRDDDGGSSVWAVGRNAEGQLGIGNADDQNVPVEVVAIGGERGDVVSYVNGGGSAAFFAVPYECSESPSQAPSALPSSSPSFSAAPSSMPSTVPSSSAAPSSLPSPTPSLSLLPSPTPSLAPVGTIVPSSTDGSNGGGTTPTATINEGNGNNGDGDIDKDDDGGNSSSSSVDTIVIIVASLAAVGTIGFFLRRKIYKDRAAKSNNEPSNNMQEQDPGDAINAEVVDLPIAEPVHDYVHAESSSENDTSGIAGFIHDDSTGASTSRGEDGTETSTLTVDTGVEPSTSSSGGTFQGGRDVGFMPHATREQRRRAAERQRSGATTSLPLPRLDPLQLASRRLNGSSSSNRGSTPSRRDGSQSRRGTGTEGGVALDDSTRGGVGADSIESDGDSSSGSVDRNLDGVSSAASRQGDHRYDHDIESLHIGATDLKEEKPRASNMDDLDEIGPYLFSDSDEEEKRRIANKMEDVEIGEGERHLQSQSYDTFMKDIGEEKGRIAQMENDDEGEQQQLDDPKNDAALMCGLVNMDEEERRILANKIDIAEEEEEEVWLDDRSSSPECSDTDELDKKQ